MTDKRSWREVGLLMMAALCLWLDLRLFLFYAFGVGLA